MALTLVESAKLYKGDDVRSAIIELFAMNSDILRVLPFDDIEGSGTRFNREQTLPNVAFRGVNEGYTEGTGILDPVSEPLVIAGGDLDVDKFIIDTQGANQRAVHEALKVKALSLNWQLKFVKGDQTSDPKEFDGLQVRATGDQLINNGTDSGGTALSLTKLDQLIDTVDDPMYLMMNKTIRRRLTAAARTYTVGGFIMYVQDEFGRTQTVYNDLPILIADKENTGSQILPFTESAYTGSSVCTSVYCLSLGDGRLIGIQNGDMDVRDIGELEDKPVFRTRVEWYCGIALYHPRSIGRLRYIKDAAVTA